jgi:hypothetical protein
MRTWQAVSRREPCRICGKTDWCTTSLDGAWALCRRMDTGAGFHKVDKAGADYWLYHLDAAAPAPRPVLDIPYHPMTQCADPSALDHGYRALLTALPLSSAHRQALRQRGFADTEILRRGYRTFPRTGRAALAKQLVERVGAATCAQIPGFYVAERDGRRWWSLAGAAGLLIPVRDLDGHIVALKVRADDPSDGPKYTTISSTKHGGPSPGAQVHVPLSSGQHGDTVRLTEGELKADVTTALSGILTIAMPGVSMWSKTLPVLQSLRPQRVLLAFDADWRTTPRWRARWARLPLRWSRQALRCRWRIGPLRSAKASMTWLPQATHLPSNLWHWPWVLGSTVKPGHGRANSPP